VRLFEGNVPGGHNYNFHRRIEVNKNPDVILSNQENFLSFQTVLARLKLKCVCVQVINSAEAS